MGDHDGGKVVAERALALSPNLTAAHATLGAVLVFSGHPKEGIEALERSLRLDPRDPRAAHRLLRVAIGHYFCGDYNAAIAGARELIRSHPEFPLPYRWLAAGLGQLGRTVEATAALEQAKAVAPAAFELYVRNCPPWFRREDYEHMLDGLRKAGWEG